MEECSHFSTENPKEIRARCTLYLKEKYIDDFCCNKCESKFMLHICLYCGETGCFDKAHFRDHFTRFNHKYAINIRKQNVFCFLCNKYVQLPQMKGIHFPKHFNLTSKSKITPTNNFNILNNIPDRIYRKYPCTILKGSINLGNTCYLNSLFNIFLYLQPFKDYFLNLMHPKSLCENKGCIICDIYDVYREIYSKSGSIVLSNVIYSLSKKNREFLGSKQYDVHEFYIKVLNYIGEIDSKLSNIFNGTNNITYKCQNCSSSVAVQENFFNLCLTIENDYQKMVDHFYESESIDDYYCNRCLETGKCIKKYCITGFPEVLVLQVKRFEFKDKKILKMDRKIKLNKRINVNNIIYKLFGTIVHDGVPLNGHYRAYITIDGKFMSFNDEILSDVNVDEALDNMSYLTFYTKIY